MAEYQQFIQAPSWIVILSVLFFTVLATSELHTNTNNLNGWSHWTEWSSCTRSCLGGIQSRSRACSWPPKNIVTLPSVINKVQCQGKSIEHKICNLQPCPEIALDSRSVQCNSHSGRTVRGHTIHNWKPSKNGSHPCELNCHTPQYGFSYSFGKVADGTPCYEKIDNKICLNGRCMPLGCDLIVGSTVKNDMCGECGGKNLTCQRIRNALHQWSHVKSGYSDVVKIPANSRSIIVRDVNRNYLALYDAKRSPIISGNGIIDPPGHYKVAGTIFEYSGAHDKEQMETLQAKGPTQSDVYVMVLIRDQIPRIYYEYWAPLSEANGQDKQSLLTTTVKPNLKSKKFATSRNFSNSSIGHQSLQSNTKISSKQGKTRKKKDKKENKNCPPCSRARNIKKQFCDSDFVLRVVIINLEEIRKETRYELKVIQSYKNKFPIQTREYLWLSENCKCPMMARFREYIIMGKMEKSISKREVRLVVNRNIGFIRRYGQKRALKVLQIKREESRLCGEDRTKNII